MEAVRGSPGLDRVDADPHRVLLGTQAAGEAGARGAAGGSPTSSGMVTARPARRLAARVDEPPVPLPPSIGPLRAARSGRRSGAPPSSDSRCRLSATARNRSGSAVVSASSRNRGSGVRPFSASIAKAIRTASRSCIRVPLESSDSARHSPVAVSRARNVPPPAAPIASSNWRRGKAREPVLGPAKDGGPAGPDVLGLHLVEQKGAGLREQRLVEAPVERIPGALAPGAGLLELASLRRELDTGPDPGRSLPRGPGPAPRARGASRGGPGGSLPRPLRPRAAGRGRSASCPWSRSSAIRTSVSCRSSARHSSRSSSRRRSSAFSPGSRPAPRNTSSVSARRFSISPDSRSRSSRAAREIALGAVTLADPAGEPLQALAEHFRGGRLDAGRRGGAGRLGRGCFNLGGFFTGRFGGGWLGAGGLDLRDPGPRVLPMLGQERSDAGPLRAGVVFQRGEPGPALAHRDVGAVVVAGEPQPAIERGRRASRGRSSPGARSPRASRSRARARARRFSRFRSASRRRRRSSTRWRAVPSSRSSTWRRSATRSRSHPSGRSKPSRW